MSLGSSDMAVAALRTAFSLLLLAGIIQGLQDVEVFHHERMEAVVGQNITLPCIIKSSPDLKIVSIEWRKNKHESTKLALYSPGKGLHLFWPNVTLQIDKTSMGSNLQLYGVTTQDSGIYLCDIASFPLGSIWTETVLEIKDLVTVPPQSNVTEEGLIEPADSSLTTSPTTRLSTTDTNVTWPMNMSTDVKDENPNSRNATAEEHTTSLTNSTHVSVTSSPITHTDPYHFNNSTDQEIYPTHNFTTVTLSDQSVASNLSTTLSYGDKVFRSTYETTNESMGGNPGGAPTLSTGNTTIVIEHEGTGAQRHLLLSLIIVPILVLIAVAGFLNWRKKRMDLPPPFKPPPPPVKYTSARHHEISTQPFPASRCNSVTELKDMKQMCINV